METGRGVIQQVGHHVLFFFYSMATLLNAEPFLHILLNNFSIFQKYEGRLNLSSTLRDYTRLQWHVQHSSLFSTSIRRSLSTSTLP